MFSGSSGGLIRLNGTEVRVLRSLKKCAKPELAYGLAMGGRKFASRKKAAHLSLANALI